MKNIFAVELAEFGPTAGDKIPQEVLKGRIAVLKFAPARAESFDQLCVDLRSKLIIYLSQKGFRVLEREDIGSVLREKELVQNGLLQSKDQALQNAEQVDYVISGSVGRLDGQTIAVTIKVVEVRTLRMVSLNDTLVAAGNPLANTPGFHAHDGFYFASNLGFGYQGTTVSEFQGFSELGLKSSSLILGIKAGWSLNPSWVFALGIQTLFLGAFGAPAINSAPDIITETPNQTKQLSVTMTGPHVTYYWPSNYFATASIATAGILYKDPAKEINIDNGYGLTAGFGREWWISKNWGIGFLVQMSYSRVELKNIDLALTTTQGTVSDRNFVLSTWSLTVSVSATYN